MSDSTQFLINHGLPLVFGAVFLEQMGLPLPASPWLLAAGALSAAGKFSLLHGIWIAVIACLVADAIWFYLGRYRGNQVLGLLCRISLEPDSCVRRTQNVFTRYGLRGLVVAKFLPGLSTVAPPLAGMSGVGVGRFLLFDGLGSVFYVGSFILLGYFFSNQIEQVLEALASVGGSTLSLLAVLVAGYIGFKFWQRHRLLRELRMARITTDELRQKLDAGEDLVILDLRSNAALAEDPSVIQGAIHLNLDDIEKRHHEIPRDRDVVVYCSCPNEVSSARVALLLHRKGFTRVRPLLGGIDAWRQQNYPMQSKSGITISASATVTAISADGLVTSSSSRPLTRNGNQMPQKNDAPDQIPNPSPTRTQGSP
jgi:membrane protein DedA with SNARE-associated domain/rhodanese-related sulfurtransferase